MTSDLAALAFVYGEKKNNYFIRAVCELNSDGLSLGSYAHRQISEQSSSLDHMIVGVQIELSE